MGRTQLGLGLATGLAIAIELATSFAHAAQPSPSDQSPQQPPQPPQPPSSSTTPPPSSSHEVAAAAFEQARRAIDAGDCPAALPKLDESLKAEPSVGAHLSYADCFESIDPYVAFWHLRDAALIAFLRHDERHASAEKRASALVAQLAAVRLSTHVADLEQSDFQVRIDSKPIDRFHLSGPLGLRPGEHTLSASTSDGRRWEKRINAEVGKVITVDVRLEDGAATKPAEPSKDTVASSSPRGSTQRLIGVIVGGVGLMTVAAGAAFGVITIARRNDLDRACKGSVNDCTGSPQVINPILVSAKNSATASNILFATGAAVLAGGIVLYLIAPSASSGPKTGQTQRRRHPDWTPMLRAALADQAVYRW